MKTAREFLNEAARRLARRGTHVFSLEDIVPEARAIGSPHAEGTLRTITSSHLCGDAPDHLAVTYDDFERVARGQYRIRK